MVTLGVFLAYRILDLLNLKSKSSLFCFVLFTLMKVINVQQWENTEKYKKKNCPQGLCFGDRLVKFLIGWISVFFFVICFVRYCVHFVCTFLDQSNFILCYRVVIILYIKVSSFYFKAYVFILR